MNVIYVCVYILSLVFLSLKFSVDCLISQKANVVYRVCCKCTWFMIFNEIYTPGGLNQPKILHSKDGMEKKLTPRTRY